MNKKILKPIAITTGEPAGIGPDLIVQIAQKNWFQPLVVIGDKDLLKKRAELLGLPLKLEEYREDQDLSIPGKIYIDPINLDYDVQPGELDKRSVKYVLNVLKKATEGCLSGKFSGLVTGPVNKKIINQSGIKFSGHTEFLAQLIGGDPVMMLANHKFRVALATTHLPLKHVTDAITPDLLKKIIVIIVSVGMLLTTVASFLAFL